MNMAIDEAILRARAAGLAPNTLRLFRWNPSAVSIGRFQSLEDEVNVEECRTHDVDIVRRPSGGGAVYHDRDGEITYSVIANKRDLGALDMTSAYVKICSGLIEAMRSLGVNASFNPGDYKQCPNVIINGRKISGSAQYHKGDVILQHGTLLIDVDLMKMFKFLRVPWARSLTDVLCVAERKITSLRHELGKMLSLKEVCDALINGFERSLGVKLVEDELTPHELKLSRRLYEEKFSRHEWNSLGVSPEREFI